MISLFLFRRISRSGCARLRQGLEGTSMTTAQFCIIAAIIIYLILMIYVGFYFSRQGSGSSSHEF